jgi:hypothetical protein
MLIVVNMNCNGNSPGSGRGMGGSTRVIAIKNNFSLSSRMAADQFNSALNGSQWL